MARSPEGLLFVTTATELPGVRPAMVDWWFGWHLPCTERYRLWHPVAHRRCRVRVDRSQLPDDRARYVGNTSWVDEYIGATLFRLAITFQDPARFGFGPLDPVAQTAVCARVGQRRLRADVGWLVHRVVAVPGGAGWKACSGWATWRCTYHGWIPSWVAC